VDAVLAERPEAEALDTAATLGVVAPHLTGATRGTAVQLYPHRHDTDAMFIQLIRRTR
jgi:16S rRNA (cytosine967-C5)-methyltransferase